MGAKFPGDIATFSTKQDLVHDVMAEHVNSLQDEVNAIQNILGTNPHIEVAYPAGRRTVYETVGARIHDLADGANILVSSVTQSTPLWVPKSHAPYALELHELSSFYGNYDPYKMMVQWGVVLPVAGWWSFHGDLSWAQGATGGNTVRKISLQYNHATRASQSYSTPGNAHCTMQVAYEGLFPAGAKIGLAAGIWMTSTHEGGLNVMSGALTARFVRLPVPV